MPALQAAEQAPAGPTPDPAAAPAPALLGAFQDPASSSSIADLEGGSVGGFEGTVEPCSSSLPRPRPSASTESLVSQGSSYQRAVLDSVAEAAGSSEVRRLAGWPFDSCNRACTGGVLSLG